VQITIGGCIDPDGDAIVYHVDSVGRDEAINGDGDTAHDTSLSATVQLSVRAERSGKGDGRVYTITFSASDGRGGTTTGTVTVGVPHNQGQAPVKTPGVSVNSFR
jgi:hypothetical protein